MMILGILLFGATLFICQAATNAAEQVFFMEIAVPCSSAFPQAIVDMWSSLKNMTGVTVKQAFKVVGEPRILAVISLGSSCNMRLLEVKLAPFDLTITTKELYDTVDLATDLQLDSNVVTLAKAKRPEALTGDHIYFAKSNLVTDVKRHATFKGILRTNIQKSLGLQIAGVKFINYNVLGEFPMQMVTFVALSPRDIQNTVWNEDHKNIFAASSMARVVQFDDYIKDDYCSGAP